MNPPCITNINQSDNSENVDYDKKEYPVYIRKGILSHYPDYSAVSHWHADLEFIVILSGQMTYNVNGKLFKLENGHGIIVNSRQFHHGYSPEHMECEFICILFHPLLLCINDYFEKHYVTPVITNTEQPCLLLQPEVAWHRQILDILKAVYQCSRQDYDILTIQQLLFTLWNPLFHNYPHARNLSAKPDRQLMTIRQMISFIQEHYKETISLDQIAASGNICKSSCSILFRKYLSSSPVTYLTQYRLNRSLELLLHTDLSITEISYETGFHNASYYAETFKKYYHCTPREYKRRQ